MESRTCLIFIAVLSLCPFSFSLPVISGPDTIEIDDLPITLTLSGSSDDIYAFEAFIWVNDTQIHPGNPYFVDVPYEDLFEATIGNLTILVRRRL